MRETLWQSDALAANLGEAQAEATSATSIAIPTPQEARIALYEAYAARIRRNPALDRSMVSYQANKDLAYSRWFKYREGFSESLVSYLLRELHSRPGRLLDPFAGSGSALFASSALGWESEGIEVLPVGIYAMKSRIFADRVDASRFREATKAVRSLDLASYFDEQRAFRHIPITRGAFPVDDEQQLIGYLAYCREHISDSDVRALMEYAAFCVLEDISYTRKDGQYLRWDARSGRSAGKRPFDKGRVVPFREAISAKLRQIADDLDGTRSLTQLFPDAQASTSNVPEPVLHECSCLDLLPTMATESFDFVLTSPPYANRYDYTRTYALELVFLGQTEADVKRLRQAMLSCTVENRDKQALLRQYYARQGREDDFHHIDATFRQQEALHEVLGILDRHRSEGTLNNDNIPRLVRNYFYEMCFVVYEIARVLRVGGIAAMVNDNVRYAGEETPVDLILSDFARSFGLTVRHIWTLGRGKGNSSQQMGVHGRTELRKSVFVWEK